MATDTEQQPTDTLQRDKRNYEQSLDETDKITQVAAARIGEGNSDTASDTNGVEVETEGGEYHKNWKAIRCNLRLVSLRHASYRKADQIDGQAC